MGKLYTLKISKIWLVSILVFDILLFLYVFVIGKSDGEVPFPENLYTLIFLLMVISTLMSLLGAIYTSLKEMRKEALRYFGVFMLSLFLFAELFVISLIYFWDIQ